jgi:hypothetical protein
VGERRSLAGREQAGLRICQKLVSRIGDVEIAHRQLSDAVLRRERRLALFHGQAFGLVRQVRAACVHDRVVVPASQLDDDLTGDGARDPPLRRLA